jgi:NADPH:quinone reductase-like Zn-dependent oxidoreductase
MDSFRALVARENGDTITAAIETLDATDLQPGDVTIRIAYSSVNYKDALALTPRG